MQALVTKPAELLAGEAYVSLHREHTYEDLRLREGGIVLRSPSAIVGLRRGLRKRACSELYYRSRDQFMVVAVELGETFRAGTPQPLFADTYVPGNNPVSAPNYDIMPDGQRFVMVSANAEGGADEGLAVILVENWFEELRERMGN